jgi:hypothetical protein
LVRILCDQLKFKLKFVEDFGYPSKLKRHLVTHTGISQLKCDTFNVEFRQKKHLNTHYLSAMHLIKLSQSNRNI